MAIDKKFKALVMRFYDNRRRTIKPIQDNFFKLDNDKVCGCCAVGAAILATKKQFDPSLSYVKNLSYTDASNLLGRSESFVCGVIDGFDGSKEAFELHDDKRRYRNGYDTGKAIRKVKLTTNFHAKTLGLKDK